MEAVPKAAVEPQEIVPSTLPLPSTMLSFLVEEPLERAVILMVDVPDTLVEIAL
jgi:hypothetical protein